MAKPSFLQRLGRLRRRAGLANVFDFKDVKVLGLEPSPELVAISMVYFVQGILGLSRLAVSFFFKDELHLQPAEVAVLTGLSSIPWMIKPLYGFISDSVPLFGYRRRSYLVLCGLMGTVAWSTLCFGVSGPSGAVACMLLASLGTAASDVVVDSIVVERARGHPQSVAGSLQSLCWASSAMGGVMSAYFGGAFVQDYGCRFVFGLTALFPLAVSASALLIDERPVGYIALPDSSKSGHGPGSNFHSRSGSQHHQSHNHHHLEPTLELGLEAGLLPSRAADITPVLAPPHAVPDGGADPERDGGGGAGPGPGSVGGGEGSIRERLLAQGAALWGAVRRRDILLPAIFVFIWQATPSADSAMFYYQTNVLGFNPEFLGRVRLGGSIASLVGVAVFNTWLKAIPLRRLLWWLMIIGAALNSSQLVLISGLHRQWGLSDQVFVLGDSMVLTVLGQVSWMPILVLAARMCPEGVEATLFATLMSVLNCGSITGGALGAALTKAYGVTAQQYDNLFALVATCIGLSLLPAPFLTLLPSGLDVEKEGAGAGGAEGAGAGQGKEGSGKGDGSGRGGEGADDLEAAEGAGRSKHG